MSCCTMHTTESNCCPLVIGDKPLFVSDREPTHPDVGLVGNGCMCSPCNFKKKKIVKKKEIFYAHSRVVINFCAIKNDAVF